jgi:hypothetical protein
VPVAKNSLERRKPDGFDLEESQSSIVLGVIGALPMRRRGR